MTHDITPRDNPTNRPYGFCSDLTLLVLYETLQEAGDLAEAACINTEWRLRQAERNTVDEPGDVVPSPGDLPLLDQVVVEFRKQRPRPDGEDG